MAAIIIFFIAHWYLSLFTQSFFDHRYAAHGAFTMSKFWERFFFIITYISQGSSYMSPRAYAIMHRMHHAYTDTEKDPHSPKYFPSITKMMLHTRRIYLDIYNGTLKVDERFLKNVPDWPALDRWATSLPSNILWTAIYISYYIYFSPSILLYLLIPVHVLMGPIHGVIINWFAHKYGYRNFEINNTSHNLLPFDVIMIGEGYHNNHHKFASSANFGYKWYEVDLTYLVILFLKFLGIIQIKRDAKQRVVSEF